jgi:hypothetical protein
MPLHQKGGSKCWMAAVWPKTAEVIKISETKKDSRLKVMV